MARVHDVARTADGAPYMVMEYLVGFDLEKVLKARGALPIEEAVDYLLQAIEALAEAHAAGIVHRDLKPANLFLTQRADGSPLVKVLDFGMSKILAPEEGALDGSLTSASEILGSPWYMSPEQVRSTKNVDHRTDVWSLGVVLYKLLTGAQAFESGTLSSCLAKIAADPPTPPSGRRRPRTLLPGWKWPSCAAWRRTWPGAPRTWPSSPLRWSPSRRPAPGSRRSGQRGSSALDAVPGVTVPLCDSQGLGVEAVSAREEREAPGSVATPPATMLTSSLTPEPPVPARGRCAADPKRLIVAAIAVAAGVAVGALGFAWSSPKAPPGSPRPAVAATASPTPSEPGEPGPVTASPTTAAPDATAGAASTSRSRPRPALTASSRPAAPSPSAPMTAKPAPSYDPSDRR